MNDYRFVNLARPLNLTAWSEHWSNGGTGVTGTSGDETERMTSCVEAFGDPEIFMKGTELHCSRKFEGMLNLEDFWRFYESRYMEGDDPRRFFSQTFSDQTLNTESPKQN